MTGERYPLEDMEKADSEISENVVMFLSPPNKNMEIARKFQ